MKKVGFDLKGGNRFICLQSMSKQNGNKDNFAADENDEFCWKLAELHVDRIDEIRKDLEHFDFWKLASIEMDILEFAAEQKAKEDKMIKDIASFEMVQKQILDFATEQKGKEHNTPQKPIKDRADQETHEWTKTMSRTHKKPFWTNNHTKLSVWEDPTLDDQNCVTLEFL